MMILLAACIYVYFDKEILIDESLQFRKVFFILFFPGDIRSESLVGWASKTNTLGKWRYRGRERRSERI